MICELMVDCLESDEIHVVTFTEGHKLLKSLNSEHPDIVFSDIKMPQMTGLELMTKIQKIYPQLPIVLVSAHVTKDNCIQALTDGVAGIIEKPFDTNKLIQVCRHVSSRYQAFKLLNRSIDFIIYQFSDLDDFLIKSGKDSVRDTMRKELQVILEKKELLRKTQYPGIFHLPSK